MKRSFTNSIAICFKKYVDFNGRAPRAEYWYFLLFVMLVEFILIVLSMLTQPSDGTASPVNLVLAIFWLAVILPGLAVIVRRLHDIDKSGWWYFFVLVPLVGPIMMIIWFCTKGTLGPNRFGPDPLTSN